MPLRPDHMLLPQSSLGYRAMLELRPDHMVLTKSSLIYRMMLDVCCFRAGAKGPTEDSGETYSCM